MHALGGPSLVLLACCFSLGTVPSAAAQAELTKAEKQQFLLTAGVTRSARLNKGVTRP